MVISADGARWSDATSPNGIRRDVLVTPLQVKKTSRSIGLELRSCRETARAKRVFDDIDGYVHT